MPRRIVAERDRIKFALASFGEGIVIKDFCIKHEIARSSLYAWRKALLTALSTYLLASRRKRRRR